MTMQVIIPNITPYEEFPLPLKVEAAGGATSTTALLFGVGTNASPATTSAADKNFMDLRCKTTGTGSNRLAYFRFEQAGAGSSGEAVRANSVLSAALATARGAQISLSLATGGNITGLGVGCDSQLFVAAGVTPGGTLYGAQSEIYLEDAASSVAGAQHAIHSILANGNATGVATVLNAIAFKGSSGTGKMILNTNSTGATESNGSIRILVDEGSGYVARYLRYWDAENS